MKIRQATESEYPAVRAALEAEALPSADVAPRDGLTCWVAVPDGASPPVGAVALEVHGRFGLLRSLVVSPRSRGDGLGGRLVDTVEAEAGRRGLEELWLLTTTADAFFAARGWDEAERASAPPEIAATAEFRDLCPASARCRRRRLSDP